MSHYTVIDTQIASAEHLVKALQDMGFAEVELHEQPQPLVGWLGDARRNTANVIVRQKHVGAASNDIGFLQTESGYFKAQISDFDRPRFDDAWLKKLTQRYAYQVTLDKLAEQDFQTVEQSRQPDGSIRLLVRRMA